MIVDCGSCVARGDGCASCMVTVLFGDVPGADVPWHRHEGSPEIGREAQSATAASPGSRRVDDDVDRALRVLAAAGMLARPVATGFGAADDRPLGLLPVIGADAPARRSVS